MSPKQTEGSFFLSSESHTTLTIWFVFDLLVCVQPGRGCSVSCSPWNEKKKWYNHHWQWENKTQGGTVVGISPLCSKQSEQPKSTVLRSSQTWRRRCFEDRHTVKQKTEPGKKIKVHITDSCEWDAKEKNEFNWDAHRCFVTQRETGALRDSS